MCDNAAIKRCPAQYWKKKKRGYPHHHTVAPLNGTNYASGAIFRTTKCTVCANVITTQSSFWRRQALISGPCDLLFSDSHQNPLEFTSKACFCGKIEDQSNSPNSVRFCNISVRPGDHAQSFHVSRFGGISPDF